MKGVSIMIRFITIFSVMVVILSCSGTQPKTQAKDEPNPKKLLAVELYKVKLRALKGETLTFAESTAIGLIKPTPINENRTYKEIQKIFRLGVLCIIIWYVCNYFVSQ